MKPYAYSISNYDDHRVFPTLEKSIEYMKSHGYCAVPRYACVTEHYEDGETKQVDIHKILEKVELTDNQKIELLETANKNQKFWLGTVMEIGVIEREYSTLIEQNSWKWK